MAAPSIPFDWSVTEERVHEVVNRLVDATHPLRIIAFGSRARGDHRIDSDLDLAVILDSTDPEVSPFPAYRAIQGVHMSVDILVASQTKFDTFRPWLNSVYNYIDREGVVIYDRDHPDSARTDAVYHSGGRPERPQSSAA